MASRRVALAAAALVVGTALPEVASAAAEPSVTAPGMFTLAAPATGNVTLAHVFFTVRPRDGATLPKTITGHVYLTAHGGLANSTILTGAATPTRTGTSYRYDAFLALIERSGSPRPAHPVVFEFGVVGASAALIHVSTPSFTSAADAVGTTVAGSLCHAISGDAAHPSVVAYVDARTSDPALGPAQRLALAQATAALCNGGPAATKHVDSALAALGAGGIGTGVGTTTNSTTSGAQTTTTTTPATAAGFTPTTLAGTWTGTWTNHTFNTNGTLTLMITASGSSLTFAETLTGNTFGCTTPAPQSFSLAKGSGANTWNAGGFTIAQSSQAFGTFTIAYAYPSGTLSGGGANPACAPGLKWSLTGGFTARAFTAQIAITLLTGPANSTVSLTRS